MPPHVSLIVNVDIARGGAFHNLGDTITISGSGSTEDARSVITEVTNKSGVTIKLAKTGSGYTKENTRLIVTGGNGTGFEVAIKSWTKQTIGGLSINTDLIGPMKNVRLDTPSFFVRKGANTASVATKLTGTVSTSTVSNTITGNIAPDAGNTNVFTFGTSSAKFNNIYSTSFTGNLAGNVSGASATLTGNLSANNIASTNDIASTTLTLAGNASVTNINTGITGIYDIGGGANRFYDNMPRIGARVDRLFDRGEFNQG